MNDIATPKGTGKVEYTFTELVKAGDEYMNIGHPLRKEFFWGAPNPYLVGGDMTTDGTFTLQFHVDVCATRETFENLFLKRAPADLAAWINQLIDYKDGSIEHLKTKGKKPEDLLHGFDHNTMPLNDGNPYSGESIARQLGREFPVLDGKRFEAYAKFIMPFRDKVSRGITSHKAEKRGVTYTMLPLLWMFDLMVAAQNGQHSDATDRINHRPEWFWLATSIMRARIYPTLLEDQIQNGVDSRKQEYISCTAYMLGDYFDKMGLRNCTPEKVQEFGRKFIASFDYAVTEKTLFFLMESLRENGSNYLDAQSAQRIRLCYSDVNEIAKYPSRLRPDATIGEKELATLISDPRVKTFLQNILSNPNHYRLKDDAEDTALTLEAPQFDRQFTIPVKEEMGDFVKKAVHERVKKKAGIDSTTLALA